MKNRLFSFIAACLIFTYASAQVQIYVKNSGNDSSNDGTKEKPYKTVAYAVSKVQANTPTIINLEENATFHLETSDVVGYAYLDFGNDKNVTVIGKNTTLSGWPTPGTQQGKSIRILRGGSGCNITLKGVNLVNGRQVEYMLGGGIYFAGNKLEVDGCKFINNESGSGGAAIGSRGKQLIVNNCYFEGNYTLGGGSVGTAIMHCGPKSAEPSKEIYLKVTNSTFAKNWTTEAYCRGAAIGIYDQATGGRYDPTVGLVEVKNCTFFENEIKDGGYESAIDLNHADMMDVFLVNNTFNNKIGALTVPFILGEITLINNVAYGSPSAISSTTKAANRTLHAFNNIFIGNERGVNENMDDDCLNAGKTRFNNVVETSLLYPISNLGLESTLSNDESIAPYLKITNDSSPLVDAGMDEYMIEEANIILPYDIRGYLKNNTNKKDIGAYEYGATPSTAITQPVDAQKFYRLSYVTDGVVVKNTTESELMLRVVGIDGKQIYQVSIKDELNIGKNELQKGLVVFILSDGKNVSAEKVLF